MKKKYIFIIIVIVIIIILLPVFFYPKENNVWGDSFTAMLQDQDFVKNKDCTCVGFTKDKPGLSRSDVQIKLCYGLSVNCKYTCKKMVNDQWQYIPCSELN